MSRPFICTEAPFSTSVFDHIYNCSDRPDIECVRCCAKGDDVWVSNRSTGGVLLREDRYECQKCGARWEYLPESPSGQSSKSDDIEITIMGIDTNGSFVVEKLIIPGDSPCSVISQTAFMEVFNPLQSLMNARPVRND